MKEPTVSISDSEESELALESGRDSFLEELDKAGLGSSCVVDDNVQRIISKADREDQNTGFGTPVLSSKVINLVSSTKKEEEGRTLGTYKRKSPIKFCLIDECEDEKAVGNDTSMHSSDLAATSLPARSRQGMDTNENVPKKSNLKSRKHSMVKNKKSGQLGKVTKRRHQLETKIGRQIRRGKFSHMEILVVADSAFCASHIGGCIAQYCESVGVKLIEREMSVPGTIWFERRAFEPAVDNPDHMAVKVDDITKQPVLATKADSIKLLTNAVLLFWDKQDFVERCARGYASLRDIIRSVKHQWSLVARSRAQTTNDVEKKITFPKVIIVLGGARDAMHLKQQELIRTKATTFDDDLDEAIERCSADGIGMALDFLLVAEACDFRIVGSASDEQVKLFSCFLNSLLSSFYYSKPNELEVLGLYKRLGGGCRALLDTSLPELKQNETLKGAKICPPISSEEISRTWSYQLQCLPGIGEMQARRIVQAYPTFSSLMQVYMDNRFSEEQKERLLEDIIQPGKRCLKMSRDIFKLMTSQNPNQKIVYT